MKTLFKLPLIVLIIALLAAGCASGNAWQDNTGQGGINQEAGQNADQGPGQNAGQESGKQATETDLPPRQEAPVHKQTVSLYFSDKELMKQYRTEKEIEVRNEADLPKAALEAWIAGPENDKLTSLVPPGVVVEYVKAANGVAEVSFSKEIKNANLGSTGEMMLLNQIGLILKQFGYESVRILVEGQREESLLGHVDISKPLKTQDPGNIELVE
ncbi:GerMN domain-containing protein [Ferviditalea candida]|uniref:GerMN domain-containing protein n=1 Tax=Ferviditalea candida TaxID=3108399 RepID=A0ABU5ZDX1_9BACL|nr:GerMN domain-containing protein [Paenibacillaceae bacterium T2]